MLREMKARLWLTALVALGVAEGAPMDTRKAADAVKAELVAAHPGERARIERGVAQVAALWRDSDGDLADFARAHFLLRGAELDATFDRFEGILEALEGHQ